MFPLFLVFTMFAQNFFRSILLISLFALFSTPYAAAQSTAQTIVPASGKAMCSALTPADFTKAGVPVSRLSQANLDDDRSAYCIYAGEAQKTGEAGKTEKAAKIEFDIFYPAGETPAEAQNAVRAAQAAIDGKFESVRVAGSDEATTNVASGKDAASSKDPDASVVVRKGTTVFNISVPRGAQSRQQLIALSEIVVSRLKQ